MAKVHITKNATSHFGPMFRKYVLFSSVGNEVRIKLGEETLGTHWEKIGVSCKFARWFGTIVAVWPRYSDSAVMAQ